MSIKYNENMTIQECVDLVLTSKDPKAIAIFYQEIGDDNIDKLPLVHEKTQQHIGDLLMQQQKERQQQEYEAAKQDNVFKLEMWKRLQKDNLIQEGTLIEIDIEEWISKSRQSGHRVTHKIQRHWQDTFTVSKLRHIGTVFFDGENMYIERGTRAPLRIFPYLDKRFGGYGSATKLRIISDIEDQG